MQMRILKYITHLIDKIVRLYSHKLTLIGLWHRHPGSLDRFSVTDNGTNSEFAKLNASGAISALVNVDPDFRITPYHVLWPLKYKKIKYRVGDEFIPEYILKLKNPDVPLEFAKEYTNKRFSVDKQIVTPKVSLGDLLEKVKQKFDLVPYEVSSEDLLFKDAEKYKDFLVDSLLDDIEHLTEKCGLSLHIEHNNPYVGISHKSVNGSITKIYFAYVSTRRQIMFSYNDVKYLYEPRFFTGLLTESVLSKVTFKAGTQRKIGFDINSGGGNKTGEKDN